MMQLWNNSFKIKKYALRETSKWLPFLQRHGVVVLADTPHDEKDENINFYHDLAKTLDTKLMYSMYGPIWDTAGEFGLPTTDSAYSTEYLPPHTDMNYIKDTPNYQIFTSIIQADSGGETIVVDGRNAAKEFKLSHPDAYNMLTAKSFMYSCSENIYHCKHKIFDEETDIIHHNDIDMVKVEDEDYSLWNDLTLDSYFKAEIKLTPGETIVINNHRVFHSRNEFIGRRMLKGSYLH